MAQAGTHIPVGGLISVLSQGWLTMQHSFVSTVPARNRSLLRAPRALAVAALLAAPSAALAQDASLILEASLDDGSTWTNTATAGTGTRVTFRVRVQDQTP